MPHSQSLRARSFLLVSLLALGAPSLAQDQPTPEKTVVKIELWMFELDIAKLRNLDLTSEQLAAEGQSRSIKLIDLFEGKAKYAPILQHPDQLLALLRQTGVARVLCEPTLATTSGRHASFDIGRSKITTTPTVLESGQIRLDMRAEHNEAMGFEPVTRQPGKKQWLVDISMILESGKTVLPTSLDQMHIIPSGKPASPARLPFVLVRATIVKPGDSLGPVRTADTITRELK